MTDQFRTSSSCKYTRNILILIHVETIRNSFKKLLSGDQLESLGVNPGLRAENLSVDDFIMLANFVHDNPVEEG